MRAAARASPTCAALLTLALIGPVGLLVWPPATAAANLEVKDDRGKTLFTYGSSYALVIWAGDYRNPFWRKLNNLRNEANQVEAALRRQGFQVTMVANPSSDELRGSLENFIQQRGFNPDNRLVIYYAGHGWTRNNDFGYLVPVDAPDASSVQGDLEFAKRALSMEQIMSWSRQMEARHVLFIFDSCFSGAIFKVRSASSPPSYLERKMSLPVRQYITAGDANEPVPAHSLFTPLLIRGLDGAADMNHDGYITGSELGEYLPEAMANYTKAQNPQYGKIRDPRLDEGDIVFRALTPSPEPATAILTPPSPGPPATRLPTPTPISTPTPRPTSTPTLTLPSPPVYGQSGTVIRTPRETTPPPTPTGAPPSPADIREISAESIVNRNAAAELARQQMPEGAKEQRSQCTVISVAGSDRFRCTIWYVVSASAGAPPFP
jgi:uncharacterized caspase-like protein